MIVEQNATGTGFSARDRYLNKRDVRDLLGFKSVRTVERMMARGHLPVVRIGRTVRFSYEAIRKHLEGV